MSPFRELRLSYRPGVVLLHRRCNFADALPKIRRLVNEPRALEPEEVDALLRADIPARLATIDTQGFPHVTPLWFIWEEVPST